MEGDLRLLDSESQNTVDMTANSEALQIYKQNLARHCAEIEKATTTAGGKFLRVNTKDSLIDSINSDLRKIGVITQ
jgi:hypothetical protein